MFLLATCALLRQHCNEIEPDGRLQHAQNRAAITRSPTPEFTTEAQLPAAHEGRVTSTGQVCTLLKSMSLLITVSVVLVAASPQLQSACAWQCRLHAAGA